MHEQLIQGNKTRTRLNDRRLLTSFSLSGWINPLGDREEGMNPLLKRGNPVSQEVLDNGLSRQAMSSHNPNAHQAPDFVRVHLWQRGLEAVGWRRLPKIC